MLFFSPEYFSIYFLGMKMIRSCLTVLAIALGCLGYAHAEPFETNEKFVNQQYQDLWARPATASETSHWVQYGQSPTLIEALVQANYTQTYQAPIVRLYIAYFRRVPDYAGFTYWTSQLAQGSHSLSNISSFFASSPEFQQTYGSLSDGQFVTLVYNNVLERAPDLAGYNYWLGQLQAGMPRAEMMLQFSDSAEHVNSRYTVTNKIIAHYRMTGTGLLSFPDSTNTLAAFVSSILASAAYSRRFPANVSKGNVTVSLDKARGGQVGGIQIIGRGEMIQNDKDGRGIGTSGIRLGEYPNYLLNEGGCHQSVPGGPGNAGNSDVRISWGAGSVLTSTALTTVHWDGAVTPCEKHFPWSNLQVDHVVWFPTPYDGAIAIKQTFRNLVGQTITPQDFNGSFNFPIAPQAHFQRSKLAPNGVSYWRYRESDGSWHHLPVSNMAGWLDHVRDFYIPSGNAVAVYEDPSYGFGVAMYCPNNGVGFYAKDMISYGTIFIGSFWNLPSQISNGEAVSKTCYLIFGSESTISSVLTNPSLD